MLFRSKTIQIGFKFLLFEKTCTVNSLEHFAVGKMCIRDSAEVELLVRLLEVARRDVVQDAVAQDVVEGLSLIHI